MEWLTLILLGIGLAASAGFRVFVPPLMLAAGSQLGLVDLPGDAAWLENRTILLMLFVATVAEVLAYYLPFIDNLLDAVAVPASLVVGTLLAGTVFSGGEPWLQWSAAALFGGGTAGIVQALTSVTRLTSTGTTAGLGNPVVSTGELISSVALSLLSLIAPLLAGIAVLILLLVGIRFLRRRRGRRTGTADAGRNG